MPHLPDVLGLGPLHFPTVPLLTVLAVVLWQWLAPRCAAAMGADRGRVERAATAGGLWLIVGAKAAASLPALPSLVQYPRLLLNVPSGPWAWAGAVLGLALGVATALLRGGASGGAGWRARLAALAPELDALTLSGLPAAALFALALPDNRALPAAAALLAGAGLLWRVRAKAARPGHLALAALVVVGCVVTLADLLRPGRTGLQGGQVVGLVLAALAYAGATRLTPRVQSKEEHHER